MESYLYGGPDDEGHIHYRDPKYNENYGGEYDGDNYCEECFSEQLEKAELAGAEN
jgi:hypothetical protein